MSDEETFESAGGFADDLYWRIVVEEFNELSKTFGGVRHCELLIRWQDMDDKFVFGNVDAKEEIFGEYV